MLEFHSPTLGQREDYEKILLSVGTRGCEYSFANQYCWGVQKHLYTDGCVAFFSHFNGKSVYPYPIGTGDRRAVVEKVMADARERGIPCRFIGLVEEETQELENWFPGEFVYRCERSSADYVYAIDDLADLKGRKFQKKRNHVNRFRADHPEAQVVPISQENIQDVQTMVERWYLERMTEEGDGGDYMLESIAINKAMRKFRELHMEGIAIVEEGKVLAMTMGSRLGTDCFDIHFEKARDDVDGVYAAINCEFARYLREKYPDLKYLDREEDMGLPGLRKAKESYQPHHMTQKCWAYRKEDFGSEE